MQKFHLKLAENFDDVLDSVILTVEENIENKKEKRRISQVAKDISEAESRKGLEKETLLETIRFHREDNSIWNMAEVGK